MSDLDATGLAKLPLMDLVPTLRPEWRPPRHLKDFVREIERCDSEEVRTLCAVPMQHHKTSSMSIGVAWLILRKPSRHIVFMTYDHERSESVAKDIRDVCDAAGIGPTRGYNKIREWQNEFGGGVVVMSCEQSRLGYPCDVLLVDDPLDEESAFDVYSRNRVDDKIAYYTARAAIHKGSVIIIASRWHPDDPIGRRVARKGWRYIHSPGILDYGLPSAEAFAPDVLSLDQHLKLQKEWLDVDPTGRKWWAQIQNDPKPDALGLFRQPARYDALPSTGGYRTVIGVDLAYSATAASDYFAIVVMRFYGSSCYVMDVHRAHRDVEMALIELLRRKREHPGATFYSYASGPEKGVLYFLAERGVPIEAMPARYDKQTRAQRTIETWNAGRVLVPSSAPWAPGFVTRAQLFTGASNVGDDDEIDALVSGYDGGTFSAVATPKALGRVRI